MMRLFITVLIILYGFFCIQAQSGFIQSYDLYEERGMAFHYMLLVEDTLVVCGSLRHPELPKWGLFFAKMDTLGNILEYKVHFDSIGHSYIFVEGAEMIRTSDGGYALVGNNFTDYSPVIFKLDQNGNKEFIKEYPDSTTWTKYHSDIIEIENGYISIGRKQQMDDGLLDAFAMRIDRQGNKIWEINYGEDGLNDGFYGIRKLTENKILLTGTSAVLTYTVNPNEDAWFKAFAIEVDTLGNILWEWESAPVTIGTGSLEGLGRVYPTSDGNWITIGAENVIETVLGEPTLLNRGEIVKRDADFNILWHTPFGKKTNTMNRFIGVVQTPNQGWVAVGTYSNILNMDTGEGYHTGMIAKVNADGDSLWSRIDTIFTPAWGSKPKLSSVVALPSGSIIACGQVDRYNPEPAKSFGWIVKVDKDGCIEPGCQLVGNTEIFPNIGGFGVFPNPVADKITIKGEGKFDVVVYEISGKQYLDAQDVNQETTLDLRSLAKGIYFLQIRKGNQFLTKKIVKN